MIINTKTERRPFETAEIPFRKWRPFLIIAHPQLLNKKGATSEMTLNRLDLAYRPQVQQSAESLASCDKADERQKLRDFAFREYFFQRTEFVISEMRCFA